MSSSSKPNADEEQNPFSDYYVDGSKIRMLRHNRGMTMQELSKLSGVSTYTISALERNSSNAKTVSGTLLQMIAIALCVDIRELLMPKSQFSCGGLQGPDGSIYMRENLIKARKKSGMTREEVAKAIGITLGRYLNLETGRNLGHIRDWDRLEDLFGIHQRVLREISKHED